MTARVEPPPRCGDIVYHRPSDEEWLVAYADPDSDTLAWSGWPDGRARLSDCDVIRRCSDTDHAAAVERWRNVRDDSRRDAVLRRYEGCTNA